MVLVLKGVGGVRLQAEPVDEEELGMRGLHAKRAGGVL